MRKPFTFAEISFSFDEKPISLDEHGMKKKILIALYKNQERMRNYLLTIVLVIGFYGSNAQTGPGIKFSYSSSGGLRIKREMAIVTYKPGKEPSGIQADTVIGIFKDNDKTPIEEKAFLKAYPNPVHDILFVENLSCKEGNVAQIKVVDGTGKLIQEKRTSNCKESLSLASVAPGSYQVFYYVNDVCVISWKMVKL